MKFNQAIEKFIQRSDLERATGTVKAYEYDLKQFCLFLRNPMITEVSESDVIAYMRMLIELNFKNNSLIPKRQAVINFFRYWRRKGYAVMDHELVPGVRREFRMPDVATEEDFRTVINSIPTGTNDALHIRNRAILLFLEATGCRNGEMCALDVDDLDFANRKVMISTEKNRGSKPFREVFWVGNDETQKALQNWLRKRSEMQKHIPFKDPEAMFVGGRGWQTGKRLTTGAVCIAMRKLSRRAGLPFTLHPHMLRHKFGHDLNNQGANGFTISDLMGHSAVNSTQIYTVMNNREARDAYTRYKSKYLSKSNQRRKV